MTPELEQKFRRFIEIRFNKDHVAEADELWGILGGMDFPVILLAEIDRLRAAYQVIIEQVRETAIERDSLREKLAVACRHWEQAIEYVDWDDPHEQVAERELLVKIRGEG